VLSIYLSLESLYWGFQITPSILGFQYRHSWELFPFVGVWLSSRRRWLQGHKMCSYNDKPFIDIDSYERDQALECTLWKLMGGRTLEVFHYSIWITKLLFGLAMIFLSRKQLAWSEGRGGIW
jgi:hypothetical protein